MEAKNIKTLIISLKKLKRLHENNPLIFYFLILSQIVVCVSFLFFVSTGIKTRMDYLSANSNMRTIRVIIENGIDFKNQNIASEILNNKEVPVENITFFFEDNNKPYPSKYYGYFYLRKINENVKGVPVGKKDIDNQNLVIVGGNENKELVPEAKTYKTGEKVRINGMSYKVIGIRSGSSLSEIPYSVGLSKLRLTKLSVLFSEEFFDKDMVRIKDYFENLFPESRVELPETVLVKTLSNLMLFLIISIFIAVISAVNFIVIYQYMLEKCRKDFIVMRICGATRGKSILVISIQMVFMFTLSFLLSLLIMLILGHTHIGNILKISIVPFEVGLILYLMFILIILLLLCRFMFGFIKKAVV